MSEAKSQNSKPINVLILPAWYNHKDSSKGVFIHEFCEAINDKKVNVTLLYLNYFNLRDIVKYLFSKPPKLNVSYNVIVAKLISLKSRYLPFLSNLFILNYYYKRVLRKLKESGIKFDVIHIQSLCNNVTPYISYRLSQELGIKYIITEHYTSYHLSMGAVFQPFLEEQFVKTVAQKAAYRIAVSKFAANLFSNYFDSEYKVIHNIVHPFFFADSEKAEKYEKYTFIAIGALDERKGSYELLNAFNKLKMEFRFVQLIFIGKGNLENSMKHYINENQLTDSVKMFGWMHKAKIIEEIDKSHILVSASELETFGLTVAEAGLRGLPVIVTKSGGPEELINEQNGLLVEKENKVVGLYNAMKFCYLNKEKYNSHNIRQNALLLYDVDKIMDSYRNIYQICKKENINNL